MSCGPSPRLALDFWKRKWHKSTLCFLKKKTNINWRGLPICVQASSTAVSKLVPLHTSSSVPGSPIVYQSRCVPASPIVYQSCCVPASPIVYQSCCVPASPIVYQSCCVPASPIAYQSCCVPASQALMGPQLWAAKDFTDGATALSRQRLYWWGHSSEPPKTLLMGPQLFQCPR